MAESDLEGQRFGDKEMGRILALAAKLQEREGQTASPERKAEPGFSVAELQQIAAEVGIEPRYVAAAAREMAGRQGANRFLLLGMPPAWEVERIVTGEASAADWEEMVAEIRRSLGRPGMPGTLGRSFEWQGRNTDPSVTVSPREGETRIRIALRSAEPLIALYFLATIYSLMGGVLSTALLHLPAPAELGIAAGILGGGLTFARQLARLWFGAKVRTMNRLMDRLGELVTAGSAAVTEPAAEGLSTARGEVEAPPATVPTSEQVRVHAQEEPATIPLSTRRRG